MIVILRSPDESGRRRISLIANHRHEGEILRLAFGCLRMTAGLLDRAMTNLLVRVRYGRDQKTRIGRPMKVGGFTYRSRG